MELLLVLAVVSLVIGGVLFFELRASKRTH
jgi:hypothetical protein